MEQVLTLALRHGFEVRSTGGSHHVLTHSELDEVLTVPAHRPIKPIYIKRLVLLIDLLKEQAP